MTAQPEIVTCGSCGARNRVRPEKLRDHVPTCGKCGQILTANDEPLDVTDSSFANMVDASSMPVLLDAWAPWCAPCRMIAPTIKRIAREMSGRIRVAKLNVDENPLTASRLGIQGIPTLVMFKNGREIDRIVGALSREAILSRIRGLA